MPPLSARDAEIVRGEAHRSLRSMAYFNVRRDRKRGATMQERLPDLGSLSVGQFMPAPRGAEIVRDGGASIKRKSCVFAKRVTKTRRNEANGMSAHFDHVFGRARIPDTVTIEQYILRGEGTTDNDVRKPPLGGFRLDNFCPRDQNGKSSARFSGVSGSPYSHTIKASAVRTFEPRSCP